ncbi:hypothetical protein EC988_000416 [Linderina pennispora]|nr:hypothetical protein EC988_000416 [Linderina pennispora]
MRKLFLLLALICLLLTTAQAKGGGGGGKGGGGGGGGKGGGGGGSKGGGSSSGSKGSGGSSSSSKGIAGGGGSSGKGSGAYGDKPPSYASLYPNAPPGYSAGGRGIGAGDASRPYTPPPSYAASANYASVNRGQTVQPQSIKGGAPSVYYAAASRSSYPGAWGYGYYPIYPYPWWAYGAGGFIGASYVSHSYNHGVHSYKSEFRNMTVVNATNTPLVGDQDIFNNGHNITFVDFNNGTISIAPCGNSSSTSLNVSSSDCDVILLDLRNGTALRGNAKTSVEKDITFFTLNLGSKSTVLRTQTISSTQKKSRGGVIAGIVIGSIAGFALIVGLVWWAVRRNKKKKAAAAVAANLGTVQY